MDYVSQGSRDDWLMATTLLLVNQLLREHQYGCSKGKLGKHTWLTSDVRTYSPGKASA